MKKIWLFLVVMAVLLSFTGCNKANQGQASLPAEEESAAEPVIELNPWQIEGIVLPLEEDDYPLDKDILDIPQTLGTTQSLEAWRTDFQASLPSVAQFRISGTTYRYFLEDYNLEDAGGVLPIQEYTIPEIISYIENLPVAAPPAGAQLPAPEEDADMYHLTAMDESENILWDTYYDAACFRLVKDGNVSVFYMESADMSFWQTVLDSALACSA